MARPPAHAPRLSRDLILSQTLVLVDTQGLEALSMRGLAQALQVNQASLYHYFSSKEVLLAEVYEHLLTTFVPLPTDQLDWQARLWRVADALAELAKAHPRMLPYFLKPRPPSSADYFRLEYVANALHDAGLDDRQIPILALHFINSVLAAFAAMSESVGKQDDFQVQSVFLENAEQHFPWAKQMLTVLHQKEPIYTVVVNHFILGILGLALRNIHS